MFLSKAKLSYCIDQAILFIRESSRYSLDKMSSITTFEFKPYSGYDELRLTWSNNDSVIIGIIFNKNRVALNIPKEDIDKKDSDRLYNAAISKIKELEDKKFLEMFPDYDVSIDRDVKLEELLGKNKKSTDNESGEKIEKKKWKLF